MDAPFVIEKRKEPEKRKLKSDKTDKFHRFIPSAVTEDAERGTTLATTRLDDHHELLNIVSLFS